MTTETDWNKVIEEHEIAYLRGDIATSSPESYSIEEMREISAGMEANTAKIDALLRSDFESMSPIMQGKMLDLLEKADPDHFRWWLQVLGCEVACEL